MEAAAFATLASVGSRFQEGLARERVLERLGKAALKPPYLSDLVLGFR